MSDTYIDHEAAKATIRTANAVERIANALEKRESGVRAAQLDKIRDLYDEWLSTERSEVTVNFSERFMRDIGEVLYDRENAS